MKSPSKLLKPSEQPNSTTPTKLAKSAKSAKSTRGYAEQVRAFAEKSEETSLPAHPPERLTSEQVKFIVAMVKDELDELCEAETLCDQVDALVDAIYYILHASSRAGINLDPIFEIVHEANMAKLRGGVLRRADGKILKPKDWVPPEPQIEANLEIQRRHRAFSDER